MKTKAKPYYIPYVEHILRLYVKMECSPELKDRLNEVEKANYEAAASVVDRLPAADHSMILTLFCANQKYRDMGLQERIRDYARIIRVPEGMIWDKLHDINLAIAMERGLIANDKDDKRGKSCAEEV